MILDHEFLFVRVGGAVTVVSENDVTLRDAEVSPNVKEISSESSVAVHIILPGWLPFSAIATERTGKRPIQCQHCNPLQPREHKPIV